MAFFSKPFGSYVNSVKPGLYLLLVVAVVRFMMLPVFNVPYDSGTTYTSMSILLIILGVFFAYKLSQTQGSTYKDVLGTMMVLSYSNAIIVSIAILIDDFGGIETYFTAPGHSLESTFAHIAGHIFVAGTFMALLLWGVGSLMMKILKKD